MTRKDHGRIVGDVEPPVRAMVRLSASSMPATRWRKAGAHRSKTTKGGVDVQPEGKVPLEAVMARRSSVE